MVTSTQIQKAFKIRRHYQKLKFRRAEGEERREEKLKEIQEEGEEGIEAELPLDITNVNDKNNSIEL